MTDWDTIVGQKVNQLNSLGDDPSAWDADSFLAILGDYGYDSVESWYEDSGQYEDLDSYSDTTSSTTSTTSEEETDWDEILKQKANQLNDIEYGGSTDWTASTAKAAIEAEGYTVEDWYDQWGKDESLDDYSELLGMTQDEFLDSDVGSYSGLPEEYNEQLLEWLMPLLESSFSNYTTNIDESSEAATEAATQAGRSAMSETAQGFSTPWHPGGSSAGVSQKTPWQADWQRWPQISATRLLPLQLRRRP